jgi:aryl-alcohol dehydrogenase-like predicted oxidoreductase
LGTEYIDLYMIHWPINERAIRHFTPDAGEAAEPATLAHTLAALDDLRREGKVRHVGVSNFGARQLADAAFIGVSLVCNELPYSLLSRAIEWEVIPACERLGVGVLGYMPLMQGLLTGKYRSADELPPSRARTRHFRGDRPGARHGEPGREQETFQAIAAIRAISEREGVSMESLAIAWSIARPAMTCTISGARNAAQLEANARAAEIRLAPEVLADLDAATDALKTALGRSVDLFESSADSRTY